MPWVLQRSAAHHILQQTVTNTVWLWQTAHAGLQGGKTCWTNAETHTRDGLGEEAAIQKKQCDHMQNIVMSKIFTVDITY